MTNMLHATNVHKQFGDKQQQHTALRGIELKVDTGEFVGIMGPSGAGKTTLLNVISTIDQPTSGEVFINGQNIVGLSEKELSRFRREQLGFIFQDYNLLNALTVRENIALPLALARLNAREIEQRVYDTSLKLGIQDLLDKYPYQISGGQKQRCAASRALVTQPKLIFADEPTGALDSTSATGLLDQLKTINEQDGATILMVTHDAFAASYCQRIAIIKDGEVFKEIQKGSSTRKQFFDRILQTMAEVGGADHDLV